MMGLRINETLQTGAVGNRTYRGGSPDFSIPGKRGLLTCDLCGFRQGENRKPNSPIPSRIFLDLLSRPHYNLHISRVLDN